ncbi:MAG: transposase [Planctomycetaceae bacterium]|nr:transposase [Planctomycetaceae bacterium]
MHLLPSLVRLQSVRRSGAGDAPARQPPQRQVLAAGPAAGDRPLSRSQDPQVLPGRCRIRHAQAVRGPRTGGLWYAIRLKANAVLERQIAHLLKRLVGRPSKKPKVIYPSFRYQAKSWGRARRVVAKVEWHAGELFPRVGFVVTNLRRSPKRVIKFYNGRGTAEQWIKEGKQALNWTRLSCRQFRDNQVRLQLFALAYNLGNFLRQLALPREVKHWSLTTLLEKLIKIGAKVVSHSKALTFQLAEVAVPRALFAAILGRIGRLRAAPNRG